MWTQFYSNFKDSAILIKRHGIEYLESYGVHFEQDNFSNTKVIEFRGVPFDFKKNVGILSWYLSGDINNSNISRYSNRVKMPIKPYYPSNYGYYLFKKLQFNECLYKLLNNELAEDANIILDATHSDLTYMNFRIQDNVINMVAVFTKVNLIKEFINDVFVLSTLFEIVYLFLKESKYLNLQIGKIHYSIGRAFAEADEYPVDFFEFTHCLPEVSSKEEGLHLLNYFKSHFSLSGESIPEFNQFPFYSFCRKFLYV